MKVLIADVLTLGSVADPLSEATTVITTLEKRELKSNEWGEWYVNTMYKDGKPEIDDGNEIIRGEKDSEGNVIKLVYKDGRESLHEFKNG